MTLPTRPFSPAAVPSLRIEGATTLLGEDLREASLDLADGLIVGIDDGAARPAMTLNGRGLLAMPGIVDIHGDAIERLIAPRPGVGFDPTLALIEADKQFLANGVTTAYHAITWSWEGGGRGEDAARTFIDALGHARPALRVDTRLHLRHEVYNLDAEPTIAGWLATGLIGCLAFNDHMAGTIKQRHRPEKMRAMVERSGLTDAGFQALVDRTHARAGEVEPSVMRLARAAREAGVAMLSHDDMSPGQRDWFRSQGCRIAEFPINVETARAAAAAGDPIVFGAPNVVRGGSHTGCPSAAEMAALGLCSVLASDYYYPALALAPFLLADKEAMPLARAWRLVSRGPAEALGFDDRGEIVEGRRADIVLIERRGPLPPRIAATIVAGRLAHLADPERLSR